MAQKQLPKFMITYLCHKCGQDFAISERDKPRCFYCDSQDKKYFEVASKQKLTPQVMAARMKLVADRLMANLKMAYEVNSDDVDEKLLLQTMDKAKKLKDKVKRLKLKSQ